MPDNLRRNLFKSQNLPTRPSQSTKNGNILTTTKLSGHFQSTGIRPKFSVSRHVTFTPSTLDHQEYRKIVVQAVPSAFKNFLREMFTGYYELKLIEERRKCGLATDYPLGGRRLPIKDLVQLQIVARDMWRKMSQECKQRYKQLAKEATRRKKQRLPLDPYRSWPTTKKSRVAFQLLNTHMECKEENINR